MGDSGERSTAAQLTQRDEAFRSREIRTGVHRLAGAVERVRRAVALQLGVGETEIEALVLLRELGEIQPKVVSARLGLTNPAVTAVLDRLERAGLAQRQPNHVDRRSLLVAISPAGRELLDNASRATAAPLERRLMSLVEAGQLDREELARAAALLPRLAEALLAVAEELAESRSSAPGRPFDPPAGGKAPAPPSV